MGKMPVLDEAALRRRKAAFDDTAGDFGNGSGSARGNGSASSSAAAMPLPSGPAGGGSSNGGSLLDLDDIFGGGGGGGSMPAPAPMAAPAASVDLLADIFSSNASVAPAMSAPSSSFPPAAPAATGMGMGGMGMGMGGMDLLSMGMMPAPSSGAPQAFPSQGFSQPPPMQPSMPASAPMMTMTSAPSSNSNVIQAFDKGGLEITMEVSKPDPSNPANSRILSRFSNRTARPMEALSFQAAVPKYLKLEMLPATSTVIPPNSTGAVTQEIRITNSMQGEKTIMLKLKVGYTQAGGVAVDEMAQVSSFPPGY